MVSIGNQGGFERLQFAHDGGPHIGVKRGILGKGTDLSATFSSLKAPFWHDFYFISIFNFL